MASSRNLEQAIQAYQRRNLDEAKRLFKIALKLDPLSPTERVQALILLAECEPDAQFKVEQYQQALQIDPTNQDTLTRLNYWSQQAAQNAASQAQQNWQNPQQQGFQQGLTPSQGMPPVQQGFTPSQGMPPVQQQNWQNPQQQGFQQGLTPSQGMPPVQQQGFQQGLTPSQGMLPIQQQHTTGSMPPVQQQGFVAQGAFAQQPPIVLNQVQRSVGISGGPNGQGTGFFVSRDGIIATTRYVVGGEDKVRVHLLDGRTVEGQVVRSFTELDLAFVQVNVQLAHLLTVSQSPVLADNSALLAVTHTGDGLRTSKRATKHEVAPHWFPTMINHLLDAGGNPVFLSENVILVGMLTKNASRSNGYMYGLHVHKIYQMLDLYMQEKQQNIGQSTVYCNSCGIASRAPSYGGFFCENCGNMLPYAYDVEKRYPQPNLAGLYGENSQHPCPNCNSQVGFYDRKCLRCGFSL